MDYHDCMDLAGAIAEHVQFYDSDDLPGHIVPVIKPIVGRVMQLEAAVAKLQAFKDWVHGYLDSHGVPHHPPGTHGAEGCRIGDRMDWLMAEMGPEPLDGEG